jgi:hypothetical protein
MSTGKAKSPKRIGRVGSKPPKKQARVAIANQKSKSSETALAKEMATYGIVRIPVDYFHFGAFRYTSVKDALAQAKRTIQD